MAAVVFVGLVAGLITGISPCILPVLPVLFLSGGAAAPRTRDVSPAGADATRPQSAARALVREGGTRPYLVIAGLAISFSIFTLAGSLVLRALHLPQDAIRWAGLVVLVLLGLAMLVPRLEDLLERPFTRIPLHLPQSATSTERSGLVLGIALGAVYVPCAGPVLTAITVAGATGDLGARTVVLTVSFAIGTAIPLLFFALAGRRVAERVRTFRSHQRAVRTAGGVVMIGLAVALALNATDAIQRAIPDYTSSIQRAAESGAVAGGGNAAGANGNLAACQQVPSATLRDCGKAPEFTGITTWLNSPDGALTMAGLKGKVVLVDFWAYSCINCQRAIKHVTAWDADYRKDGLVVVGVHTPEYAFEQVPKNVAAGAERLGITYPIAIDDSYGTWNAYGNDSWPADYLIDATGEIRYVSIGEGSYAIAEQNIRTLLADADPGVTLPKATDLPDTTPTDPYQTRETYLGSERAQNYSSGSLTNGAHAFTMPGSLQANTFGLGGTWTVGDQSLAAGGGAQIKLSFTASKVYLDVGGSGMLTISADGRTTTQHVSGAPNIHTVVDVRKRETSTVTVGLTPGLQAYSFTFG